MESFEIVVDHEVFRVAERSADADSFTYDFSWTNGPAGGTYGFTVGSGAPISRERLAAEAEGFVRSFYSEGGIGPEDFPDHVPASVSRGRSS